MTPDKNQNINLLPADLQRKRAVIKNLVAKERIEYTEAQNGAAGPGVNMLPGRVKSKKKDGFLSGLFGSRPPLKPQTAISPSPAAASSPQPPPPPKIKPTPPPTPPVMDLKAIAQARLAAMPKPAPPQVKPAPPPSPLQKLATPAGNAERSSAGRPSFGVNLLHEEYAQAFHKQNQKSVFLSAIAGTVLLIILAYVAIHLYQARSAASARATSAVNQKLEAAIASYNVLDKDDKALARKVTALKSLLDKHISLRAFLEKLEAVTIAEVSYLSIAASQEGGVTITALARDYTALARQITVFQEAAPWVRSAVVASAALSRDTQGQALGVEFDLTLMVDPAVFAAGQ